MRTLQLITGYWSLTSLNVTEMIIDQPIHRSRDLECFSEDRKPPKIIRYRGVIVTDMMVPWAQSSQLSLANGSSISLAVILQGSRT